MTPLELKQGPDRIEIDAPDLAESNPEASSRGLEHLCDNAGF